MKAQQVDTGLFRDTPLFYSAVQGQFLIVDHVVAETIRIFKERSKEEELVFWAGVQLGDKLLICSVVAPKTERTGQSVFISERDFGIASKATRANNVSILAQVHSHPGRFTWHSDGDDNLILFPYDGMLSLVAPNYGHGISSINDFSIHQFQNGKWTLGTSDSIKKNVRVISTTVDCR